MLHRDLCTRYSGGYTATMYTVGAASLVAVCVCVGVCVCVCIVCVMDVGSGEGAGLRAH